MGVECSIFVGLEKTGQKKPARGERGSFDPAVRLVAGFFQTFAWTEAWHDRSGDLNFFAGLWIAACARRALLLEEGPETDQNHVTAILQLFGCHADECFECCFGLGLGNVASFGDCIDYLVLFKR